MYNQSNTMSPSAQISQSTLAPSSPPPRPKRVNPFKRALSSPGSAHSGSGLMARITGTSSVAKAGRAKATPTALPKKSVDVEEVHQESRVFPDVAADSTPPIGNTTATVQVEAEHCPSSQPSLTARASSASPPLPLHRSSSAATSTSSAPASPLLAVGQPSSYIPRSGATPSNFSRPSVSPMSGAEDSTQPIENSASSQQANTEVLASAPRSSSRGNSVSEQGVAPGDDHMVAQAAQLVLEAARKQAQAEIRKKGKSAPASPKALGRSFSPVDSHSTEHSETQTDDVGQTAKLTRSSSRGRSKSDAGTGDKVKSRKSFFRTFGLRSDRAREGSASSTTTTGNTAASEDDSLSTNAAHAPFVLSTPGGRRRRFVDTRDIDFLIRELAAEAIAEQVPQPPFARASRSGSSSPLRSKGANTSFIDPRRKSFPSILEDAPMQDSNLLMVASPSTVDKETLESSEWDAESTKAPATPRLPSDDPAMSSVPLEMFTGLGGSPYPSLVPSIPSDPVDSFGNSVGHDVSDAASVHQPITPRRPSQSSSSQTSTRRPVLTMTMNDPEAELQGLTRPPKSKKSTPFASRAGSRAGSRAASPRGSFSNLKQEAEKWKLSTEADQTLTSPAANQIDAQPASPASSDALSAANAGSNTVTRFSSIFRPSKTKAQFEPSGESSAISPTSPQSIYASPRAELQPLSPGSAAVSTHSDTDVSPVAFRLVDLPSVEDPADSEKPPTRSTRSSFDVNRRPSLSGGPDSATSDQPSGGKKGIRKLLRRLSSFGSSHSTDGTSSNSAKVNFPDNSTMPAIDHELLKKLNEHQPQKGDQDAGVASSKLHKGLALTGASLTPDDKDVGSSVTRQALGLQTTKGVIVEAGRTSQDRRPSPHLVRTNSRTPSSEDSVFQSSDNSYSSGRESAGLFKQGSESVMSEELNTPEVSSGYLPDSKQAEEIQAQLLNTSSTGERTPLAREL